MRSPAPFYPAATSPANSRSPIKSAPPRNTPFFPLDKPTQTVLECYATAAAALTLSRAAALPRFASSALAALAFIRLRARLPAPLPRLRGKADPNPTPPTTRNVHCRRSSHACAAVSGGASPWSAGGSGAVARLRLRGGCRVCSRRGGVRSVRAPPSVRPQSVAVRPRARARKLAASVRPSHASVRPLRGLRGDTARKRGGRAVVCILARGCRLKRKRPPKAKAGETSREQVG